MRQGLMLRGLMLGLLLAALSTTADAESASVKSAEDWLAGLSRALRETNYQGTVVYLSGTRVETLKVFHAFEGGVERERWLALTGTPREVVRDGRRLLSVGNPEGAISYQFSSATRWTPALALAQARGSAFYRSALAGSARIAGRPAQIVDVAARDHWRYGYRLWLDKASGLPLRVAVLGGQAEALQSEALEQLAFSDIAIGQAPSDRDLQASPGDGDASVAVDQTGTAVSSGVAGWRVLSLPPGFELRRSRQTEAGLQLLYSDGLASFSVYVESMPADVAGESATRHGAVTARGFWRDGVRVVAVGKVPAVTTERIARTICASPPPIK